MKRYSTYPVECVIESEQDGQPQPNHRDACYPPVKQSLTILTPQAPHLFLRKLQAHLAVVLAFLGPILADFHEQEEMHAAAEDFFEFES